MVCKTLAKFFFKTFGEWAASERRPGAVERIFSTSPAEEADVDSGRY